MNNSTPISSAAKTSSTFSQILVWINITVTLISFIIECSIFLPLITNIFRKNSTLISGFFVIFTFGCGIDLIYSIAKILMEITRYENAVIAIYANLAQWYCLLFFPFWMTILAMNRLTALIFVRIYKILWSNKSLIGFCVGLMAYPFIVDGYTFFTDLNCRINTYTPECQEFMVLGMRYTVIIGFIHACITFVLGLSTYAFVVKLRKRQKMSKKAKMEIQLLFQSIFSSALMIALFILELLAAFERESNQFNILRSITNIMFDIWHILSILMLIAISKQFRVKFFEFYHIAKILKIKDSSTSKIFANRIAQKVG